MNTTSAILSEHRSDRRTESPDPDRTAFVDAMAAAPTAVTVVVHSDGTRTTAQTVSAFASVTADPPTLLVCINQRSRLLPMLTEGEVFSVNLLSPEQSHIADSFAGRAGPELGPYDIERVGWRTWPSGIRTISGAASSFLCRVEARYAQGTHGIVVARVLGSHRDSDSPFGLSYCQRDYRTMVAPSAR